MVNKNSFFFGLCLLMGHVQYGRALTVTVCVAVMTLVCVWFTSYVL